MMEKKLFIVAFFKHMELILLRTLWKTLLLWLCLLTADGWLTLPVWLRKQPPLLSRKLDVDRQVQTRASCFCTGKLNHKSHSHGSMHICLSLSLSPSLSLSLCLFFDSCKNILSCHQSSSLWGGGGDSWSCSPWNTFLVPLVFHVFIYYGMVFCILKRLLHITSLLRPHFAASCGSNWLFWEKLSVCHFLGEAHHTDGRGGLAPSFPRAPNPNLPKNKNGQGNNTSNQCETGQGDGFLLAAAILDDEEWRDHWFQKWNVLLLPDAKTGSSNALLGLSECVAPREIVIITPSVRRK